MTTLLGEEIDGYFAFLWFVAYVLFVMVTQCHW